MTVIEQAIEIAAPPAEVFAFFVPQRMPYWYGPEMNAAFEVSGGAADFAVSQKVRISAQLGRKDVSHTAVVTRYEWLRVLEWRFEDSYGVRGLERWELQPVAAGTRVVMRSEYEMPGTFAKWIGRFVTRRAVVRRNRDYLARLKKLAERR
jgi:uncharacterized protein YndB with AHSA1/START domain